MLSGDGNYVADDDVGSAVNVAPVSADRIPAGAMEGRGAALLGELLLAEIARSWNRRWWGEGSSAGGVDGI